MIRSGKRSKESSPAPSRGSSLRGSSANEAKRTVLRLENDDWSDDETGLTDVAGADASISVPGAASPIEPPDMATVAQMMKSTVRKRSPKVRPSSLSSKRSP